MDLGLDFDLDHALGGVLKQKSNQDDIDEYNALKGITPTKSPAKPPAAKPPPQNSGKTEAVAAVSEPVVASEPEPELEGFEVKVTNDERPGVDNSTAPKKPPEIINWKDFKEIHRLFEYIGGERPVGLYPDVKRSQVSGIIEPLMVFIQEALRLKYDGIVAILPYKRRYKVDQYNKVFVTKSSLIRYLMFDSLNDIEDGFGLQLAKQWFSLNISFTDHENFDYKEHVQPNSDEFDVYALLVVADQVRRRDRKVEAINKAKPSDLSMDEQIRLLTEQSVRLLKKFDRQEELIREQARRNDLTQTLLLLDRMGLLKGSLPKDIDSLIGLLEQNRDVLTDTGYAIDKHIDDEAERQATLARQQRKDDFNNRHFTK